MDNRAAKHVGTLFCALVIAGCTSAPAPSPTIYYDPETGAVGDELGMRLHRESIKQSKLAEKEVPTANNMEEIAYTDSVTGIYSKGNQQDELQNQIIRTSPSREEVIGISSHDTSDTVISRDNLNIFILGIIALMLLAKFALKVKR